MSSLFTTLILVAIVFFAVLLTAAAISIISRLNGIEQHLERTTILLTILANIQGATQEDITRAVGGEESALPPAHSETVKASEGKKKNK